MKRIEPDWDELQKISQRAESMQRSGRLNYQSWRSLVAESDTACHGDVQYSEFLYRFANSGWLKKLFAEPKVRTPKQVA